MTFNWSTPPWERFEDATYTTVMISVEGTGTVQFISGSARGENPEEALSDLLMGPGGAGVRATIPTPQVIGVVIRPGIDLMWLSQPPIRVHRDQDNEWQITVPEGESAVTFFPSAAVVDFLKKLVEQFGTP